MNYDSQLKLIMSQLDAIIKQGSGGSGTVTNVSGTTNRVTVSSQTTTPVIDISSTFEALLGKVASPLSQFALTTSSQLASIISDETGTGALVFGTAPIFTTSITSPIVYGSASASSDLLVDSTSHATKGNMIFGSTVLPTSQNSGVQFGTTKVLQGNLYSATVGSYTPTFTEYILRSSDGVALSARGAIGMLSSTETNLCVNMDYTTAVHKYYDTTKVACWMYVGNTSVNMFGIQWVPANNSNSGDIWTANGSTIPFKVDQYNQPATGSGIMGFSKLYTAVINLVDITNTASTTNTPININLNGGVLEFNGQQGFKFDATLKTVAGSNVIASTNYMTTAGSGAQFILGIDERLQAGYTGSGLTCVRNYYNSVVGTAGNLKLGTSFTNAQGNFCEQGVTYATTAGYNVGAWFEALGGNVSVGLIGKAITAKNSAKNLGVIGVADNTGSSPTFVGGFFGIGQVDSPTYINSALMADNGTKTSNPIFVAATAGTEVFRVDNAGVLKFTNSSNNTTGVGSALLGTNSPAVTNTAPYTWIKCVSSDGSTVYIPAWK